MNVVLYTISYRNPGSLFAVVVDNLEGISISHYNIKKEVKRQAYQYYQALYN
jgi:hypothetical protein